jgi:hypothetical protein
MDGGIPMSGLKGPCHVNHKISPYLSAMQFAGKYPWWIRIWRKWNARAVIVRLLSKSKEIEFFPFEILAAGK